MAVIGSLTVKLGLVTVEWDKATAQAKQQAKDLQSALKGLGLDMTNLQNLFRTLGGAAGLSVAGLAAMSHAVMEMAGAMQDLSDATGVSGGKILQFQSALVMAGGKAEDAKTIIGALFTKIAAAQDGNDVAISQFEQLGISFAELKRMAPDEAINRVYQGLSKLGNSFERVRQTRELLGKAGLGKSIDEIAEALGKSTAEFDRSARALKEWDKMGDALNKTFINLKLAFAELLAPFTTESVVSINQFKSLIIAITAAATVNGMFRLVAAFKALNTALRSTAALSLALSAAGGLKGIATGAAALAAYLGAMKVFEEQDAAAAEEKPAGESAGSEGMGGKEGGTQAMQLRARLALMKEMMDIDRRRNEYQLAWMSGSQDELKLAESRLKFEEDIAKAKSDYGQAMAKENLTQEQMALNREEYDLKVAKAQADYQSRDALINAQREKAIKLYEQETEFIKQRNALSEKGLELETNRRYMTEFEFERAKEQLSLEQKLLQVEQDREKLKASRTDVYSPEYQNELKRIKDAEQSAITESALRMARIKLNEEEATSWAAGWDKAFRQFAEQSQRYGDVGANAFNSVIGNMSSAIDTFVKTGKLSFKSLIQSMIQDLIALQMKMLAMSMIRQIFGSFGGFGGGSWVDDGSGFSTWSGDRAAGGGMIGGATLVGENGPELFIPQTSGTIVPNQQLSSYQGNQPQVVYNGPYIATMTAIDTQSATQFLAKNKTAVWAANQSASRSMPTSR